MKGRASTATKLVCLLLHVVGVGRLAAAPAVFTVTTTRDAGPGSFRDALNAVNRSGGNAAVTFRIPVSDAGFDARSGTWTITVLDTLPPITVSRVRFDGDTQTASPGSTNGAGPRIVLCGNGHSVENAFCLLNAAHCTICGFVIGQFLYGIQVYGPGAHDNRIAGNHIGIDAAGQKPLGNYNGVELLSGAHDNVIGGGESGGGNLVSGNQHIGIRISDAHRNVIIGNRVGLDAAAVRAVPNCDGICIEGRSTANRVGGVSRGERNIVSGNVAYGVDLFGWGVSGNLILGNYIGTDRSGMKAVPNTYGVLFDDRAHDNILGGLGAGECNLISGNTAFGAYCYNHGTRANVIRGNLIGTDASGEAALPNETGVHIDGGTVENVVDANVIAGNLVGGVTLFGIQTDRNRITRNLVGVGRRGARQLGNGADGVRVAFGPRDNVIGGSPEQANVIAHSGGSGVVVESGSGNRISCNSIRDNARAALAIGAGQAVSPPVIVAVRHTRGVLAVTGSVVPTAAASMSVEVFADDRPVGGLAQARVYLGTTRPVSSGRWTFEVRRSVPPKAIAASAIDAAGNTSQLGVWLAGQ